MIDLDKMVADAQARLTKALDDDVSFHRTEAKTLANQLKAAAEQRHDIAEKDLLGDTIVNRQHKLKNEMSSLKWGLDR